MYQPFGASLVVGEIEYVSVPKVFGDWKRVDVEVSLLRNFITRVIRLPAMAAAKRYGEFVADFYPNGSVLCKA